MTHHSIISNFIWKFFERCSAQGVVFIVTILLARILDPSIYGTIALIIIFINFTQVFIDSGLGVALIQKKDADIVDFSTVFYFNLLMGLISYSLLFMLAPFIADFYNNQQLTKLIRVLSVILPIYSIKNIQQAYIAKNMLFKFFFFATLCGAITGGIIGIYMAYNGYGVWSIVAQQLITALIDTIVLWLSIKWRPQLLFSIARLKSLSCFGWKILLSSIIATAYENSYQLIIGKLYSPANLAYYNQGNKIPSLIIYNINTSIDSILLPTLSTLQEDKLAVKEKSRTAVKISTYILAPIMMGLIATSNTLVPLVLTEKWNGCIIYMNIFCIIYMFYPLHTVNLNAIKALGRSDIFLTLEIIKKIIGITILALTMFHGVFAIALGLLLSSFLSQIINSYPNKNLINYSYKEQLIDILPCIGLSIFMGATIYALNFLTISSLVILPCQIICGIIIYITGSILFKLDSFFYCYNKFLFKKKHIK